MSKKRIKPNAEVVADRKQAEGAVAMIASLDREIKQVELYMQDSIDQVKAEAEAEAAPLLARRKELASALQGYATMEKEKLFKDKKSLAFPVGIIGFRQSTQVKTKNKVSAEMVLGKLKDFGMKDGIKVTEKLNREAMREWSDEKLDSVGMRRVISDKFFIEIPQDELGGD